MRKYVELDKLRPNNWFLDKKKLEIVRQAWRDGKQHLLPAVIVTTIDNELSLLDGHCRAFAAWENGAHEIPAKVTAPIRVKGDLELITIFHQQGPVIGIKSIEDLGKRIMNAENVDRMDMFLNAGRKPGTKDHNEGEFES